MALEERSELLAPDEALTVAQAGGRLLPRGEQGIRVEALDLQPVEVERFQRPGELDDATHPIIELDVDGDPDPRSDRVPEGPDPADGFVQGAPVDGPVAVGGESRRSAGDAFLDEVRLEDLEATLDDLARAGRPGLVREGGLVSDDGWPDRAVGREMRPVERDPVSEQAADQLVDGHAQPLCLDVPERQVQGGKDLHPFRDAGPTAIPDPLVEELDPHGILTDQGPAHDLQGGRQGSRRVPVVGFGPAGDALVRRDLDEPELAQATVAHERLDRGDLHGRTAAVPPPTTEDGPRAIASWTGPPPVMRPMSLATVSIRKPWSR